jgi:acyl carrier protein
MEKSDLSSKIKKLLVDQLGLELTDVEDEDSLIEDLHMTPSDISDFMEILKSNGFDTSKLDFTEIETFGDLYEKLS